MKAISIGFWLMQEKNRSNARGFAFYPLAFCVLSFIQYPEYPESSSR